MEWRKIFVTHISGERLISSIYKELLQFNQQKTKKSIKTGHRTWIDISPKKRESTLWVNLVEKFSHFGDLLLLLLFPLHDRLQIALGQGLINKRVFLNVCSAYSFRYSICTCTSKRASLYLIPLSQQKTSSTCDSVPASRVVETREDALLSWLSFSLWQMLSLGPRGGHFLLFLLLHQQQDISHGLAQGIFFVPTKG